MTQRQTGIRFWVIAPWGNRWTKSEEGRVYEEQWQHCKREEKIWIGWKRTGDLSDVPINEEAGVAEIKRRLRAYRGYEPKGLGKDAWQIWRFKTIQPGDIVVAKKGLDEIAGIGVVRKGYSFDGRRDFPHGLEIDWRDTDRRRISRHHWRLTVNDLDADELGRLGAYTQRFLSRTIRAANERRKRHQATDHKRRERIKKENLKRVSRTSVKRGNGDEDLEGLLRDVPDHRLSHRERQSLVSRAQRNARIAKRLKIHYDGKCQICDGTFRKRSGENYAEIHHLAPNDHPKNLIVLCATCHRKLHYADVQQFVVRPRMRAQRVLINGEPVKIRYSAGHARFFQ